MKLEYGKRYVLRNGSVIQIVFGEPPEMEERYPFKSEDSDWYTEDGHFYHTGEDSDLDIISEFIDSTDQPEVGIMSRAYIISAIEENLNLEGNDNEDFIQGYNAALVELAEDLGFTVEKISQKTIYKITKD